MTAPTAAVPLTIERREPGGAVVVLLLDGTTAREMPVPAPIDETHLTGLIADCLIEAHLAIVSGVAAVAVASAYDGSSGELISFVMLTARRRRTDPRWN